MNSDDKLKVDLESLARELELFENPMTEKQRDIMRAAERLFSDGGYTETSTATIAKEAGVTEKTLFKHFPTKADLLRRVLFPLVLRTFIPIQLKSVKKMLAAGYGSYREMVVAFALDRWALARAAGPRMKFVASEMLKNDKLRGEVHKLFVEHVWSGAVAAIRKHQQSGELRSDIEAEQIARAQMSLIIGQAFLRGIVRPGDRFDDEADAQLLAKILTEGVAKRSP